MTIVVGICCLLARTTAQQIMQRGIDTTPDTKIKVTLSTIPMTAPDDTACVEKQTTIKQGT